MRSSQSNVIGGCADINSKIAQNVITSIFDRYLRKDLYNPYSELEPRSWSGITEYPAPDQLKCGWDLDHQFHSDHKDHKNWLLLKQDMPVVV